MEKYDLEYINICIEELDKKYQFYFDSVDVIRIVQGVNRFYRKEGNDIKFKINIFDQNETIVHCLTFGKFLNCSVKLLPTHQAELSRLIKNHKVEKDSIFLVNSNNILKSFLESDLNFFSKLKDITTSENTNPDNNYIGTWINDKAKEIFKAIYFSYKASYTERLEEIFSQRIIETENYDLKDIEIYNDELFLELSNFFRSIRPGKEDTGNNFNDVAAFMYLAMLVDKFNKNNNNLIPVYFDSKNYADRFPKSLLDRYYCLELKGNNGKVSKSYAFRKWHFFQIYSLLNSSTTLLKEDDIQYLSFADTKKFIERLHTSFVEKQINNEVQVVEDRYEQDVKQITKEIDTYINVDFYKTIINRIFHAKIEIVNKILNDFKKERLNPESADIVNKQGEIFLEYLNVKIDGLLQESSMIYHLIESRLKYVNRLSIRLVKMGDELDVFKHYSLFRFFIPKEFQNNIKLFFSNDGMLSDVEERATTARITLWNLYYKTFYFRTTDRANLLTVSLLNENEMYLLYSSFWILSLHDKISDFNYNLEYFKSLSHSLLMLIGATINRTITEANSEEQIIGNLKNGYKTIITIIANRLENSKGETSAQMSISLAYLYFHLWQQNGNELILERPYEDNAEILYNEESDNFKAIKYAREAYEFYKSRNETGSYLLYSLNIYIYYVIEAGTKDEFTSIQSLITHFIKLKGFGKDWHFRYDDTAAKNLHRISKILIETDSKLNYINHAIYILKNSLDKIKMLEGRDINEVRTYLELLISIKSEIELKLLNKVSIPPIIPL